MIKATNLPIYKCLIINVNEVFATFIAIYPSIQFTVEIELINNFQSLDIHRDQIQNETTTDFLTYYYFFTF